MYYFVGFFQCVLASCPHTWLTEMIVEPTGDADDEYYRIGEINVVEKIPERWFMLDWETRQYINRNTSAGQITAGIPLRLFRTYAENITLLDSEHKLLCNFENKCRGYPLKIVFLSISHSGEYTRNLIGGK